MKNISLLFKWYLICSALCKLTHELKNKSVYPKLLVATENFSFKEHFFKLKMYFGHEVSLAKRANYMRSTVLKKRYGILF